MFNVEKMRFADCLKEENLVFLPVQLCNVDQGPFVLQEIMLQNVLVLPDYSLVIHMLKDVNKLTALKMMTAHMTNIVTDFPILA